MQVQIIKIGEDGKHHIRQANESFEGATYLNWLEKIDTPIPEDFDPSAQEASHEYRVTGNGWERFWTIRPLSEEEKITVNHMRYLQSLNWVDFGKKVKNYSSQNSAYRALTEWSHSDSAFTDAKFNIEPGISSEDHDMLYAAFLNLKQLAKDPRAFTNDQIIEINNCLENLGARWRWETL